MMRTCLLTLSLSVLSLTSPLLAAGSGSSSEAALGGDPTGISGRVTRESDGLGVPFSMVNIYDTEENLVVASGGDDDGDFLVTGLNPGTYFAAAGPSPFTAFRVLGQVFDGISCPSRFLEDCDFSLGTPIQVVAGSITEGVDFSLPPGAIITGRVREAGTGEPVPQALIRFFDEKGRSVRSAQADRGGRYRAEGLGAGRVFAQAQGGFDGNHGAEAYPGIPCDEGCQPTDGEEIDVAISGVINGIDFTLPPLGELQGTIVDEYDIPLQSSQVRAYDENGQFLASTGANKSGSYRIRSLTNGSYRIRADGPTDFVQEVFDDIACDPTCDTTTGDLIPIVEGQTTDRIDFQLAEKANLSGTVHDQLTGRSLNSVVMLFDEHGSFVDAEETGGTTFRFSLPEGRYFAVASRDGYVPQLFAEIPCPGAPIPACDPSTGTPIDLRSGIATEGVAFGLVPLEEAGGTHLRGRTLDADSGRPVGGATVELWRSNGTFLDSRSSSPLGAYQFSDLTPGTYFATARNGDDHKPALFENLPCSGPGFPGCDPTTGTPISVLLDEVTEEVDFALTPRGKIAGKVTQASNQQPLQRATVTLYDADGSQVSESLTDENGGFEIAGPAGTYYAVAFRERFEVGLFGSPSCPNANCDPTEGTPLVLSDSGVVGGVDFSLRRLGAITGKLWSRSTGQAVSNGQVHAFNAVGDPVRVDWTDQNGLYRLDLDPGTYTIAGLEARHMTQLFNDVPCPFLKCDPTQGTPLLVEPAAETVVDFSIPIVQGIAGRVTDADTQEPLADIAIDLWNPAVELHRSTLTLPDGTFAFDLLPGSYYVSTDNPLGYEHQVFADVLCPNGPAFEEKCDPRLGMLLEIPSDQPVVHQVDFILRRAGIFGDGFESGTTENWSSTVPASP